MRNLEKFSALMIAALALTAIAAPNASAGTFTANAASVAISGVQATLQEFNLNGIGGGNLNKVTCTTARTSATTPGLNYKTLTVEVIYNGCTAFSGIATEISKASYTFHVEGASGGSSNNIATVDVNNMITIAVKGATPCNVTVAPQASKTNVTFNNASANTITGAANVTNITSVGNGGLCGSNHNSGSYVGTNELSSSSSQLQYDKNP